MEWPTLDVEESMQWLKRIMDRGNQNSCGGHGGAGAMEAARAIAGFQHINLSPCCIYGQINGGRDQGALIQDVCCAGLEVGTTTESLIGPRQIWRSQWPAGWESEAKQFRYFKVYDCRNFDEVASALLSGYTVCYGILIGQNFGDLTSDSFTPPPPRGRKGGHALYALPYGLLRGRDGRWGVNTPNSWSTRWGNKGRCVATEDYFREWTDAFAVKAVRYNPDDPDQLPIAV